MWGGRIRRRRRLEVGDSVAKVRRAEMQFDDH